MTLYSQLSLLGKIVRLQLQPSTLSLGERPNRYYDPSLLMPVNELTLTPQGALARLPEDDPATSPPSVARSGRVVLDVHHLQHPNSKNIDGENDLSVNFTAHYEAIREQFGAGAHLYNGCAGENILVQTEGRVNPEMVSRGVAVRTAKTGEVIWLQGIMIARPCQPFSLYASRASEPDDIKAALQFLDNGTRGFYCRLSGDQPVTVAMGDEVFTPMP